MSLEELRNQIIQNYRASSGEDEQNLSGSKDFSVERESTSARDPGFYQEEPSAGRKFRAGFSQGRGITSNLLSIVEARNPEMAGKIYSVIPGLTDKGDLDDYYGTEFSNPYLTNQNRRDIISQQRRMEYEHIYGDVEQSGFWYGLGKFSGELADPTTVLPAGAIWRVGAVGSAAIWGGLYAGADSAVRSVEEQGAIDIVNAGISIGAGAALGAAAQKLLIGPIQNLIASKSASGSKVTPGDIEDAVGTVLKGTEYEPSLGNINFQSISDELNYTIFNKSPEEQFATFVFDRDSGRNMFKTFDEAVWDYKVGKVDEFTLEGKEAFVPPQLPFKRSLAEDMAAYRKVQREARRANQSSQDAFLLKKYREANPQPKNPAMREALESAWAKRRAEDIPVVAEVRNARDQLHQDIIFRDVPMETIGSKIIQEASTLKSASGNPLYSPNSKDPNTLLQILQNNDLPYLSETADLLSPKIGKMLPVGPDLANLPDAEKITKGRSLIAHLLGAKYGGKPRKLWEAYGPAGKMMSDLLTIAEANKRRSIAGHLTDFNKVLGKANLRGTSVEAQLALDVVRKTVKSSEVSPTINKVADTIRNIYRKALRDQYEAGVIDGKEYQRLANKANKLGYVNRIYKEDLLSTKAGQEHFAESMAKVEFESNDELMGVISSILGEKSKKLKDYSKDIVVSSETGKRTLSKDAWRRLNNERRMAEPSRSRYIDNERVIHEKFEEALKPFLENDPSRVLAGYLEDVYTRIEYAKVFGANDQLAHSLIAKIGEVADHRVVRTLEQVYWDSVKDPRSENIQSFVNMSDGLKRVGSSLRAFEILNLAFAQILNLGQPITTGTIKLSNTPGIDPFNAFAISMKGLINGTRAKFGNAELREMAERSGAANQALITHMIGGMNELHGKIIPMRDLPGGLWNPINTLNNPQEFLRFTQFFNTEHMAKMQGYFQGKAAIEHLLDKKAKLLAKGNRANPKSMENINASLEELGIPRNLTPDQVDIDLVERGAAMFSDIINFTPSSNELPLAYNSFFGKISRQFQTFSFNAGSFIGDHIIAPLKKGNVVPLATYLSILVPGVGMPIDAIRRTIVADDRDFTATDRYLRGMGSILGLGIVMDTVERSSKGPLGLVGAVAGPAAQDISAMAYGVSASAAKTLESGKLELSPLASQAKSVIPQSRLIFEEAKQQRLDFENHFKNQFKDF